MRIEAGNCALELHRLRCGAGSINGLGGRGREVTVSAVGKAGARGLVEREEGGVAVSLGAKGVLWLLRPCRVTPATSRAAFNAKAFLKACRTACSRTRCLLFQDRVTRMDLVPFSLPSTCKGPDSKNSKSSCSSKFSKSKSSSKSISMAGERNWVRRNPLLSQTAQQSIGSRQRLPCAKEAAKAQPLP